MAKLEMILVTQMQTEGSTFYRAEAVTAVGTSGSDSNNSLTTTVRNNEGKPQPKLRPEPATAQEEA